MNYQAYSYTDFDIAQIYKGDDFVVSDGIVIHQNGRFCSFYFACF